MKTVSGLNMRIVCMDRKHPDGRPILALIESEAGIEYGVAYKTMTDKPVCQFLPGHDLSISIRSIK